MIKLEAKLKHKPEGVKMSGTSAARVTLIVSMLLAMNAAGADEAPIFDIPRMDGIVIDGKTDDWNNGGFRIELLAPVNASDVPLPFRHVSNHDAACRLAWNNEGLLIAMTVTDDNWIEDPDDMKISRHDCCEFYLAPSRTSPEKCQWVVAGGMTDEHRSVRISSYDYKLKKQSMDIRTASTRDGNTCRIEALLPWKALGIRPVEGTTAAVQLWSRDSDTTADPDHYYAVWYPMVGTFKHTSRMHTVRLSSKASPPVLASSAATCDLDRLRTVVTMITRAEYIGKTVRLSEAGKVICETPLAKDPTGRAAARIVIPFNRESSEVLLQFDGGPDQKVSLPDPRRAWAEAVMFDGPSAQKCVFSGSKFPEIEFERPLRMERLIGPYEIETVFYDQDYNVITSAVSPGRYGAVVTVKPAAGPSFRRFLTLFRTQEDFNWGRLDLDMTVRSLPTPWGIDPLVADRHTEQLAEFLKRSVVEKTGRGDDLAVFLAGTHGIKAADSDPGFYGAPEQKDRAWWVGLKRRLHGWADRWPKPVDCPRPIEGEAAAAVGKDGSLQTAIQKAATVVRDGTPAEAGMKPDAAAQIDAVLTQWANDTDEAFAVCIVRHGVIVLHKAYGTREGKPMTLNTKSWMASTTKMLSGACIMMLVDQGRIGLDDPIDQYLPPLKGVQNASKLTMRHLYTHSSGLTLHWGAEADDMEERIAVLLPCLEVGKAYNYNGTGMELGCKILEAVSGESLPEFYRNHLLGPLGCANTDIPNASSGASSVPLDMARIGQMLLNKGAYGRMRFFSEETFKEFLPQKLTKTLGPDTGIIYGIGTRWFGEAGLGEGAFGHAAASSATIRIVPAHDMVICMTRNSAGSNFDKYHQRFIDAIVNGIAE